MARPRKNKDKRRSEFTGLWLTPAERVRLEKQRAQTALPFSEFARRLLFEGEVNIHPASEQLAELIWLVRRAGVNLHQAVKIGHFDGALPEWIDETRAEIEEVIIKLQELELTDESRCR